jgi:hypothetical protein
MRSGCVRDTRQQRLVLRSRYFKLVLPVVILSEMAGLILPAASLSNLGTKTTDAKVVLSSEKEVVPSNLIALNSGLRFK